MAPPARNRSPLQLWVSLMHAHTALHDSLEAELEATVGIPLGWHEVLARLVHAPEGRLRMQDLAREVLLSKSGLTRLVDRMEMAGLITRESCDLDRRGTYAVVTADGRDLYDRAHPVIVGSLERQLGKHLTVDESRVLSSALEKIVAANPTDKTACLPPEALTPLALKA